jgi:hypothetical protein
MPKEIQSTVIAERQLRSDIVAGSAPNAEHIDCPPKVMKIIKRGLEDMDFGEDEDEKLQLLKDTVELFTIFSKELPYCGANVATLLAERARWHILGAKFSEIAIKVGITTPHGMLLLDKSLAMSNRAESSAIKAYNLSIKLAQYEAMKNESIVKTPWLQTEGESDED